MRVQIYGAKDRTGVQHVSVKSSGTVVLRFSDHKEYLYEDDHSGFNISPE